CENCGGRGTVKSEVCPACRGSRFNARALGVRWKGRTIADVQGLSLRELESFAGGQDPPHPQPLSRKGRGEPEGMLLRIVGTLNSLGLGSITAGQALGTLSGGEAQRLRLHRALTADLANALYLFEEPTASLHPDDVERLLPAFLKLRDAGNTVVAV